MAWEIRVDSEDHYVQAREERGWWWIHLDFETHKQGQPKSETESTSGSTKWWLVTAKFFLKNLNFKMDVLK